MFVIYLFKRTKVTKNHDFLSFEKPPIPSCQKVNFKRSFVNVKHLLENFDFLVKKLLKKQSLTKPKPRNQNRKVETQTQQAKKRKKKQNKTKEEDVLFQFRAWNKKSGETIERLSLIQGGKPQPILGEGGLNRQRTLGISTRKARQKPELMTRRLEPWLSRRCERDY